MNFCIIQNPFAMLEHNTVMELKNGLCGQKIIMNGSIDDYKTVASSDQYVENYDGDGFSTCVPQNALRVLVVKPQNGNTYVKIVDHEEDVYYLTKPTFSLKNIYAEKFVAYAFTYFENGEQVLSFYDYLGDVKRNETENEDALGRVTRLHSIMSGMCLGENLVFRFHWSGQESKCMELFREKNLPWECVGVFRMHNSEVGRLTRVVL